MKGNDLILDFGDFATPEPKKGKTTPRATKSDKKQSDNMLHNTEAVDAQVFANQPAENTSSKKVKKETKVSTPKMDKTEKKTYKQYTPDEIMKSSVDYFHGDELAANVWMNKYALRDGDKIYEPNPDMMHRRIASEFARLERKYPNPMSEEEIYGLLKDFRYIIPQGSPMSGIGNNFQVVSLSNCFVIGNSGNSDSYGGIMKIDQEQV